MYLVSVLMAPLLIAFLFTLAYALSPAGRRTPLTGRSDERAPVFPWVAWFFLTTLLLGWAAAIWVGPVGPLVWGVAWIPLVFVAVTFLSLMILWPLPPAGARNAGRAARKAHTVFAIFCTLLFVAVIWGLMSAGR